MRKRGMGSPVLLPKERCGRCETRHMVNKRVKITCAARIMHSRSTGRRWCRVCGARVVTS